MKLNLFQGLAPISFTFNSIIQKKNQKNSQAKIEKLSYKFPIIIPTCPFLMLCVHALCAQKNPVQEKSFPLFKRSTPTPSQTIILFHISAQHSESGAFKLDHPLFACRVYEDFYWN